ncbi:hypothetical protein Taro_016265 [Colocasia esculenta]|uniref:Uncharacterized protein n=1 Tax=Colocasia esculenta TaxID=4460 RepID=A0A843UVS2_COLES|nr:hypothetical protein [Colocasia esculenta]
METACASSPPLLITWYLTLMPAGIKSRHFGKCPLSPKLVLTATPWCRILALGCQSLGFPIHSLRSSTSTKGGFDVLEVEDGARRGVVVLVHAAVSDVLVFPGSVLEPILEKQLRMPRVQRLHRPCKRTMPREEGEVVKDVPPLPQLWIALRGFSSPRGNLLGKASLSVKRAVGESKKNAPTRIQSAQKI